MEVYWVEKDNLNRVPEKELAEEATLENHLIKAEGAEIGSVELLYIGRQGRPDQGGIFDVLAIDEQGDTVVVELKRDKAPREIIAQVLDYASGIRHEEYADLNRRFHEFLREHGHDEGYTDGLPELVDAHADYFDLDDALSKREFNTDQRFILVGTEFRDVSLNMADFLREHEIDVICVEYNAYATADGEIELLTTDGIRRPLNKEPSSETSYNRPDYSQFTQEIRDRVFPEIQDLVTADEPDDVFGGDRSLRAYLRSNHPDHTDNIAYLVEPKLDLWGGVDVAIHISGGSDDLQSRIQSALAETSDEFQEHGFEVHSDQLLAIVEKKMEYEVEPDDIDEEILDEVATAYVKLIRLAHPKIVQCT